MKQAILIAVLACLLLTGCAVGIVTGQRSFLDENQTVLTPTYVQITQKEAKERMDSGEALVLDVRRQDEYDDTHIPGAVLLPVETITAETAAQAIPSKDTQVLVYCRSGNRSKQACKLLAELGYTGLYEFGGINTWPYEVE